MNSEVIFQKGSVVVLDQRYYRYITEFAWQQYNVQQIDQLGQLLFGQDIIEIHHAIIGLRKIIACEDPPIDRFVRANIIPKIVELARQNEYPHVLHEAVWILTNVASCQTQYVRIIVELGVIEVFVNLLHSDNDELVDEAIWALGNICGDSSQFRDEVIKHGLNEILQCLRSSFRQKKLNIIFNNACWAISNIIRVKPLPPYSTIKEFCLLFIDILESDTIQDQAMQLDIIMSIVYSCNEKEVSARILDGPLLQKFVNSLKATKASKMSSTLMMFTNLIQGDTANFRSIILKQPVFLQNLMELWQRCLSYILQFKFAYLLQVICFKDQLNIEILISYEPFLELKENEILIKCYKNVIKYGKLQSILALLGRVDMCNIIMDRLKKADQETILPILQCIELLLLMNHDMKIGESVAETVTGLLQHKDDLFNKFNQIMIWKCEQIADKILRIKEIVKRIKHKK